LIYRNFIPAQSYDIVVEPFRDLSFAPILALGGPKTKKYYQKVYMSRCKEPSALSLSSLYLLNSTGHFSFIASLAGGGLPSPKKEEAALWPVCHGHSVASPFLTRTQSQIRFLSLYHPSVYRTLSPPLQAPHHHCHTAAVARVCIAPRPIPSPHNIVIHEARCSFRHRQHRLKSNACI
jgi:hypothetical protein